MELYSEGTQRTSGQGNNGVRDCKSHPYGNCSQRHVWRPELQRALAALAALGLDVHFHRASDSSLFYNRHGVEHRVIDFVAGFGATLWDIIRRRC